MHLSTFVGVFGSPAALLCLCVCYTASACSEPKKTSPRPFDAWADMVSEEAKPKWKGQRVTIEPSAPRPELSVVTRSLFLPLAVHANPEVPAQIVARALVALEQAYEDAHRLGWKTRLFDLYLDVHADEPPRSVTETRDLFSQLDSATSFGLFNPKHHDRNLEACTALVFREGVFIDVDPAEASTWRRASAHAWAREDGLGFGDCDEDVAYDQTHPFRTPISFAEGDRVFRTTGLFLSWLSERWLVSEKSSNSVLFDLWHFASQRTWEGEGLRASPDLWAVLFEMAKHKNEKPLALAMDYAVARFFAGPDAHAVKGASKVFASLPKGVTVPAAVVDYKDLPKHFQISRPPIEPWGSMYAVVNTEHAPETGLLRVWLEGELGVRWQLAALRLDAQGGELSRTMTPPSLMTRHHLVLEPLNHAARVLIVAVNLTEDMPDADRPDQLVRAAKIIVSR